MVIGHDFSRPRPLYFAPSSFHWAADGRDRQTKAGSDTGPIIQTAVQSSSRRTHCGSRFSQHAQQTDEGRLVGSSTWSQQPRSPRVSGRERSRNGRFSNRLFSDCCENDNCHTPTNSLVKGLGLTDTAGLFDLFLISYISYSPQSTIPARAP